MFRLILAVNLRRWVPLVVAGGVVILAIVDARQNPGGAPVKP